MKITRKKVLQIKKIHDVRWVKQTEASACYQLQSPGFKEQKDQNLIRKLNINPFIYIKMRIKQLLIQKVHHHSLNVSLTKNSRGNFKLPNRCIN